MKLWRTEEGGTLVEYAMVLPLLMALTFGVVDLGYILFQFQGASKASIVGARKAVILDQVAGGLANFSGTGNLALYPIGTSCMDPATFKAIGPCDFGSITCTSTGCTGANAGAINTASFNSIVAEMQKVLPQLQATNVSISYAANGLGFVGFPVPSTITVRIVGLTYQTFALSAFEPVFPGLLTIPPSPATLIGEDLKTS